MSERPVVGVEQLEAVLLERAEALAAPEDDQQDSDVLDVAILRVGGERYAVELSRLTEVCIVSRVARVPGVRSEWAGMIAVRGVLFPVLDLARILGLAREPLGPGAVVVLVSAGEGSAGLLVDGVPEVTCLRQEELGGGPAAESPSLAVTSVTPGLVSLLDLDAVLSDPRFGPTVPLEIPGGNR